MSTEHAGKSDEVARFKAEVTQLVEQGYTMDEVARMFGIRNGPQREAFKRKYTPPAVPSAAPLSPVAPGPAVPPEGHEGENTGSAMRIVSYREVAEHVYEVVIETAEHGQRTRRVLVLPESLMGDEEAPKGDGQGDDQGPRYGWTLSGFKAREAAKKFSEGMISGPGAGTTEGQG